MDICIGSYGNSPVFLLSVSILSKSVRRLDLKMRENLYNAMRINLQVIKIFQLWIEKEMRN